jgi:hypothetical protein
VLIAGTNLVRITVFDAVGVGAAQEFVVTYTPSGAAAGAAAEAAAAD